ncbi:MAG: SemiSWEET family sugar transporter [Reyranellaceae bacterium]
MNAASALGYLAGFLTTVACLPQVVRAWRTKSTTDLSFPMLALFSTGLTLWTFYGLMLGEAPSSCSTP